MARFVVVCELCRVHSMSALFTVCLACDPADEQGAGAAGGAEGKVVNQVGKAVDWINLTGSDDEVRALFRFLLICCRNRGSELS